MQKLVLLTFDGDVKEGKLSGEVWRYIKTSVPSHTVGERGGMTAAFLNEWL